MGEFTIKYEMLIIDGPYLSHRSYSVDFKLTTTTGLNSTLIFGFLKTLNALKKQFTPDDIIVTWESYGTPSWRKKQYPL